MWIYSNPRTRLNPKLHVGTPTKVGFSNQDPRGFVIFTKDETLDKRRWSVILTMAEIVRLVSQVTVADLEKRLGHEEAVTFLRLARKIVKPT